MKKFTYLIMIAFMAFSFYSCKEELILDSTLDVEFLEAIPNEGGSRDLKFKASNDWVITINETKTTEWLTVTPMSGGKGDVVAKITAAENPNHDGRKATITISIGDLSEEITVVQKQLDSFTVSGTPTEPFPLIGGEFEIIVSENTGTPTVDIKKDDQVWIEVGVIETKALKQTTLKFTVKENTLGRRSSEITINSGGESEIITVIQIGDITISVPVKVGDLLVSDRNLGDDVPKDGVAYNYTNDEDHPDHQNSAFKGDYYTWKKAKTACPDGWRLPTEPEIISILFAVQQTEGRSYLEDEEGNRCYFPLGGQSEDPFSTMASHYWASTTWGYYSSFFLRLDDQEANNLVSVMGNENGFLVRCVEGEEPQPGDLEPAISVPIQLANFLISDRYLGDDVPKDGVAYNYTNAEDHPDHRNSAFKGDIYTWEEALIACPEGWRLPTEPELQIINNVMKFSDGRVYVEDKDDKEKKCYFPLSGFSGVPNYVYMTYWSSTPVDGTLYAYLLYAHTDYGGIGQNERLNVEVKYSVRCVQTVE